jgi:uncharacterized membrane protein
MAHSVHIYNLNHTEYNKIKVAIFVTTFVTFKICLTYFTEEAGAKSKFLPWAGAA